MVLVPSISTPIMTGSSAVGSPQGHAKRLAAVHCAMKYYQPATERSVKNVAANVDGAKVTIVVLGGPQTAGDLYERVIGALHPAERDHIDLIDARELFQAEYADSWPAEVLAKFLDGGGSIEVEKARKLSSRADRDAILARADVVVLSWPYPLDLASRCPKLKWVHSVNAGASNLRCPFGSQSADFWGSATIRLTTARGHNGVLPIAEYVLASIFFASKDFGLASVNKQELRFSYSKYQPRLVAGKTIGIVGLGGIGTEVARLCKAFGLRVVATRRTATTISENVLIEAETGTVASVDAVFPASALPKLLSQSDFVVIALQWTPETTRLIGSTELAYMRPSATLINVARGEIVDQQALLVAMKAGKLAGAILDVYDGEFAAPPPSELWRLPNVLITPHVSGRTDPDLASAHGKGLQLFAQQLLPNFLRGHELGNLVDYERGY